MIQIGIMVTFCLQYGPCLDWAPSDICIRCKVGANKTLLLKPWWEGGIQTRTAPWTRINVSSFYHPIFWLGSPAFIEKNLVCKLQSCNCLLTSSVKQCLNSWHHLRKGSVEGSHSPIQLTLRGQNASKPQHHGSQHGATWIVAFISLWCPSDDAGGAGFINGSRTLMPLAAPILKWTWMEHPSHIWWSVWRTPFHFCKCFSVTTWFCIGLGCHHIWKNPPETV